jgi:NADH-quinone oxidoreductase subunit G
VSETVTFKLNGKDVTVPKGTTVMEAARRENVDIPHFCWHPGLSVAGVCRFCMVKVEGRPKLEIACNLQATNGMDVKTDTDEAKSAHKWALEFHLINHPLDCPICDQAGECGLQDYYMSVGKYQSQMTRPKVLKPKMLDVGRDLVLDTERCILCSRCVRFEEEVTKTGALGIFDRGDRAIIGTYPGEKIEHNYQTNLVDICPVGAFTSRDFRFKQRVWFLKDKPAVCPGCSTGCSVDVYGKPETRSYFRLKPRKGEANGHWMCDKGRHMYSHLNQDVRLRTALTTDAQGRRKDTNFAGAIEDLSKRIAAVNPATDVALLVSAQHTSEEYKSLFDFFVGELGIKKVFQWREPTEKIDAFDGLLYRGDHNANTRGLLNALKEAGLAANLKNEFDAAASSAAKVVIAITPEVPTTFPSFEQQLEHLRELDFVSFWTLAGSVADNKKTKHAIPMKGFPEKKGTFINHEGKAGKLDSPFPCPVADGRDLTEIVAALKQWRHSHGSR